MKNEFTTIREAFNSILGNDANLEEITNYTLNLKPSSFEETKNVERNGIRYITINVKYVDIIERNENYIFWNEGGVFELYDIN